MRPEAIHQSIKRAQKVNKEKRGSEKLSWWQLSLIGIGSIIGAGFFLGTGVSVRLAGESILLSYLIGGITVFIVFRALAQMSIHAPQSGAFRAYARFAFGPDVGFLSGWVYWIAGVLIMSSEVTAISVFTRYWFPGIPLWIFAVLYSALALGINLMGVKNFGRIESSFAIIKLGTLLLFILFGFLILLGLIPPTLSRLDHLTFSFQWNDWFPNGFRGVWSSLLFVLFSYGGVEVLGIAAAELKKREDLMRAGRATLSSLTLLYILALYFVLLMTPWQSISPAKSPFVTALAAFQIPYLDSFFNFIIITAAFSIMVATLFSISRIMVSLAQDGDAPPKLAHINSRGIAIYALLLSATGLALTILLSFFLPARLYELVTSSAGVLLILNWILILSSHIRLAKNWGLAGSPYLSYGGILLILVALSGTLNDPTQRIGLIISLALFGGISLGSIFIRRPKGGFLPETE
ncbi:conserved membrane hypothetical protein [[Clostridium] ultunense Esp]|nr:conserved membrane hypothetical protein [[Clostridium] ultunense Esp]